MWALEENGDENDNELERGLGYMDRSTPSYRLLGYKEGGLEATFEQTPYAQYWDSLPNLADTGRMYAFNAVDRVATVKYLMNCTYIGMFGDQDSHQSRHFLWLYVDQLDWMRRSGRLSPNPGGIKVDHSSWWGWVSYALTVVPLSAALDSGLWSDTIVINGGQEELGRRAMRRAVRAWRRVWLFQDNDLFLQAIQALARRGAVHDALVEQLRGAHWAAVLESLRAVEACHGDKLAALPQEEQEFARGWLRAAQLLAVAKAPTDLDGMLLRLGAGYAPERVLCPGSEGLEHIPHATTPTPPGGSFAEGKRERK
ncbi:unnamed protein product, partial [Discosporangium mesarthrocarpum]